MEKIEIAGPGFINFTITNQSISNNLEILIDDDYLGVKQIGNKKTIIIDYSSPNVAKPMHIGHIRSTVIGNALDRLYRFQGYNVISDNHLGDWGTQFGLMIIGYREFVDKKALDISPIDELERIYVKSYNKSKNDNEWKELAKKELVKLQQGDKENLALWENFVKLSLNEFEKIYKRLDIKFNLFRGESYYNSLLPNVISKLEENLIKESDGAKVVDLEEQGMPVCIVEKSDGGFNYTTTDLATVFSRQKEFSPEKMSTLPMKDNNFILNNFFKLQKCLDKRII